MPNSQIILLASARTYRNQAFTEAAQKLGLEVALGLDVPPPLLPKMQNCFALDYRDHARALKAILKYAATQPVCAVLGVDDAGTVLAAHASAALGLAGNAPEATEIASDKALMRRKFSEAGVPSPAFYVSPITQKPDEILNAMIAQGVRFPCVLKPTRLSASKGVMRADNAQEFYERFARLRLILEKEACEELIVENFFAGVEVALEGLLNHGQLYPLAIFDKPDPLDGPFFEETIYVTPSRLPTEAQNWIIQTTERACVALGLREGPIHAELRLSLTPNPLFHGERGLSGIVVEVAARSIGGLCSRTLRFAQSENVTLEELILRQAVGLELNVQREAQAGGVMMIPIPAAGLLREVTGIEAARRVPLIEEVEITAPLNYPLVPLPEGDSYLGFIFARGPEPAAVEAALREAHQLLRFTLTPEIPLAPAQRLAAPHPD